VGAGPALTGATLSTLIAQSAGQLKVGGVPLVTETLIGRAQMAAGAVGDVCPQAAASNTEGMTSTNTATRARGPHVA
jgi:hypothetical protein